MQRSKSKTALIFLILFGTLFLPGTLYSSIPGFYPNPVIEIFGPLGDFLLPDTDDTEYLFVIWLLNKPAGLGNNEDGHSPKLTVEVTEARILEPYKGMFSNMNLYGNNKVVFTSPNSNIGLNTGFFATFSIKTNASGNVQIRVSGEITDYDWVFGGTVTTEKELKYEIFDVNKNPAVYCQDLAESRISTIDAISNSLGKFILSGKPFDQFGYPDYVGNILGITGDASNLKKSIDAAFVITGVANPGVFIFDLYADLLRNFFNVPSFTDLMFIFITSNIDAAKRNQCYCYNAGDICNSNGVLYRLKNAIIAEKAYWENQEFDNVRSKLDEEFYLVHDAYLQAYIMEHIAKGEGSNYQTCGVDSESARVYFESVTRVLKNEEQTVEQLKKVVDMIKNPSDTTPPDTTITGGPSGTITTNSATFTYTGSDLVTPVSSLVYATYLQGYDSGWSGFSSSTSKTYNNLPNGPYTFQVKAKDQADNEDLSPATRSFTVNYTAPDTTPPDTTITGGPSGTITTNSATFTYTGSDLVTPVSSLVYATYLQGYDSGWSGFSSSTSKTYNNLPNGPYTFQVKAKDQADNEDLSPATRSFTVNYTAPDTTPPDTTITGGPSGTITTNSATFTYTGSDLVTPVSSLVYATYLQGYDSGWSGFSSSTSKTYNNLPNGPYTFQVKAKDQADNEDLSPATRSFTVNYTAPDTTPPDTTITGGPSGTITTNSATFTYTGSDLVTPVSSLVYATYLQGYDSGWSGFSSSTSKTYNNLPNGPYTFQVKAKDQAGNEDSTPSTRSFTVNYMTPPYEKKALYVPAGDTQNPNITQILTDHGFEIVQSSEIPSDLTNYRLIILSKYEASNQTAAGHIKSFVQNGGGAIIMSGTPSLLASPWGWGITDLSSIRDWFGAGTYGNDGGYGTVAIPNPFGTDLLINDKVDYSTTNCYCAAAIYNLESDATLISKWSSNGVHSFSHSFGQGRVFYYAGNPGYFDAPENANQEMIDNSIELFEAGLLAIEFVPVQPNRCDFNGDGKTDILWRNKSTGQNVVWLMNGTTYSSYAELLQVADTNWQIVGTGDFNGDGKTDILWRNKISGQNVIWLMNGTIYSNYVELLQVPDTNWQIVGTGDFNGDGKTDIVWRNKSTGQNVVWFMNGATYSSYAEIMQVTDINWQIVGTGDFNSDGKVDILWRNKSTGQNVVWYMNGAVYSSYAELMQVTDTNWQIVGTGDFNGDGKVDILWRNKSTGQNIVWLMNGITYSSYAELLQVTDTNWEIVGPK